MLYEKFFDQFVDGYLLSDLRRLNRLKETEGPGNCGYLIVQGVLTGYDLLGSLISEIWTSDSGPSDFYCFISSYMKSVDADYYTLETVLWESARNKLAHSYLTRDFMIVHKGKGEKSLIVSDGELHIYCKNLIADFIIGVKRLRRDIDNNAELQSKVNKNVGLMMREYALGTSKSKKKTEIAEAIKRIDHSIFRNTARASGASLSTIQFSEIQNVTASGIIMGSDLWEEYRKWLKQSDQNEGQ